MKKLYSVIFFSLLATFCANSQTSDSPWAVSLGANLVGVQDDSEDSSTGFGVPPLVFLDTLPVVCLLAHNTP